MLTFLTLRSWSRFGGMLLVLGTMATLGTANDITAIDTTAGDAFDPNTTHAFSPARSLSFAEVLFERFKLSYADAAGVGGFTGRDVVQLGRYYVHTTFGCITHCESPDFNGVDGILGFGLPDAAVAGLRTPLFMALSDANRVYDKANDHILTSRQFTVLADDESAELQLGGYDPECTELPLMEVQTTSAAEYSVPLESVRIGSTELLDWTSDRVTSMPAIFDSGTSCLVLPDTLMGGVVTKKPYSTFMQTARPSMSIYLTIKGREFEIPYKAWWLAASNAACVQPSPALFLGALLGDVVFRSLVVMFDLVHLRGVKIAVGQRRKDYKLVQPGESHDGAGGIHRLSLIKRTKHGYSVRHPFRHSTGADRIAMHNAQDTQFFVNVSVGTPRQSLTVIFDTGSSVFAVFCDDPHQRVGGGKGPVHVYLPRFIPSGFLQTWEAIKPESHFGTVMALGVVIAMALLLWGAAHRVASNYRRRASIRSAKASCAQYGATAAAAAEEEL